LSEDFLVFTGRPNAGKSSIIRAITGLKVIVGKDPGTTRKIEMYSLAPMLTLVDMPGYGRSLRGGRDAEDQTKDQILNFIDENALRIALAIHVVNTSTFIETVGRLGKKGFISVDVEMVHYMKRDLGIQTIVAANKIDKSGEAEIRDNLEALIEEMGPSIKVFPVSARTEQGIGALKDEVHRKLVDRGHKNPFELVR
jgi:GTP-binding protein EngB required for normal cell division